MNIDIDSYSVILQDLNFIMFVNLNVNFLLILNYKKYCLWTIPDENFAQAWQILVPSQSWEDESDICTIGWLLFENCQLIDKFFLNVSW